MAQLYAFREDRLGSHYQLGARTVLGTAPECDLILFDRNAHPQQAEIFQVDEHYYLADLSGAQTTLANGEPVTLQTRLEPYDTIEIGQELLVFEPGLSVIVGPAPPALIIHDLAESFTGLLGAPAEDASGRTAPEDWPALMALSHQLARETKAAGIRARFLEYLRFRFEASFAAALWPSRPPARRLTSLLTSSADRRLLLSRTPFLRAVQGREALAWPRTVTELSFHNGDRLVATADRPCLVGPLIEAGGRAGLLYVESPGRAYTEQDLAAFAACLTLAAPALSRLAEDGGGRGDPGFHISESSEAILSSEVPQVKSVFATAAQAAESPGSILLTGEAGTGKSALAEFIHKSSPRREGRLVTVNLAAQPQAEIERILFGQASAGPGDPEHPGLLEMADSGTLFLRHVEFLSPPAQKALLQVLEDGLFYPLGGLRPKAVDLRLISATAADLEDLAALGHFRRDLLLRLSRVSISMPPLRETRNDLEHLINQFLHQAARDLGLVFTGLEPAALECLRNYNWPGNITELKRVAGLLVLFSRQGRVARADLPAYLRQAPEVFQGDDDETTPPLVREAERHQLVGTLARHRGDLETVAELLNLRPEAAILKIRSLGLDPIDYQPPPDIRRPAAAGRYSE